MTPAQHATARGFILLISILLVPISHAAGSAAAGAAITAAIADPDRPAADRERDETRKPREMLELARVHPGESIAELMPGGGYFTRLFSKVVGSSGHVYALVPAPAANAPPDVPDFAARGGMIGLIKQDERIRFEINLSAVRHAQLRLSSKLLRLGVIIRPPAREEPH